VISPTIHTTGTEASRNGSSISGGVIGGVIGGVGFIFVVVITLCLWWLHRKKTRGVSGVEGNTCKSHVVCVNVTYCRENMRKKEICGGAKRTKQENFYLLLRCNWFVLADILLPNGNEPNLNLPTLLVLFTFFPHQDFGTSKRQK